MRFWSNPEFVRYLRAELRPPRLLTAVFLVLVICALVGLGCWAAEQNATPAFFRSFYGWLVGIQFTVLSFWCASSCGQAISREREMKTYDFLKTTRLTPVELLVGKLTGAPILGWFTVGCSVPVSAAVGILGGFGIRQIFWTYVLMLVFALFLGLLSLWISMLLEKSSAAATGVLAFLPVFVGLPLAMSDSPGFGAISILAPIFSLYGVEFPRGTPPTFFGRTVSFVFLSLLLYVALGAWFVLMLARNIKKDVPEIRLLSRWQSIGFVAFLNVLFYALLNFKSLRTSEQLRGSAVGLNAVILFLVGLALLTPYEKLKVWSRKRAAGEAPYLSDDGLPWPWLVLAALLAYLMLVATVAVSLRATPIEQWRLGRAGIEMLVLLIFITRDILFLQWCSLTGMKRPVVKGFLYLWLYYIAVGVVAAVASASEAASRLILNLFTPFPLLNPEQAFSGGIYIGLPLQIGVIYFLLTAITGRLRQPITAPAASA